MEKSVKIFFLFLKTQTFFNQKLENADKRENLLHNWKAWEQKREGIKYKNPTNP